mgnify:CR=1 FL=1
MNSLYDNIRCDVVLETTDLATSLITTAYVDMLNYHRVLFVAHFGTISSSNAISVARLVQATASAGTGVKALGYSTSGAIQTFTAINQATQTTPTGLDVESGRKIALEANAISMDGANLFRYAAMEIQASQGTSTFNVTIVAIRIPKFCQALLNASSALNILKAV